MRLLRNSSQRGLFCVMGASALVAALLTTMPGSAKAQVAASTSGGPASATAAPATAKGASSTSGAAPAQAPSKSSSSGTGAPSESPAPSGAAPVPSASATSEGGYTVRLRSLEKNVNELKEQIFRTKARLNLLKETVLGGTLGASRAVIHHKNEMGSSYRLIKAVYALDGVQIFSKSDESGRLAEMSEFDIYNGAIQPGSHTFRLANGFLLRERGEDADNRVFEHAGGVDVLLG